MTQRRKIFIISCFAVAFAVASAGFALQKQLLTRAEKEKEAALAHLTVTDCAEYIEKLCGASGALASLGVVADGRSAALAEISLYSSLAANSLGHIGDYAGKGREALLSFLSGYAELAKKAAAEKQAEGADRALSDILTLASYAETLSKSDAFALFSESREDFDKKLYQIFGGTELETLFYENDIKTMPKRGFETIRTGIASEKDVLSAARKYLGKNARLEVTSAGADIPVYTLCGRNTYAAVSRDGEKILSLMLDTDKGRKRIDEEEALGRARSFLESEKIGVENAEMTSRYEDGVYLFRFTPMSDGTVCLDETITVGITHGSGRICIFDAVGYYRYHASSSDALQNNVRVTAEEAAVLGGGESALLCKISPMTGVETLCYRVIRAGGEPIFINAMSGRTFLYGSK